MDDRVKAHFDVLFESLKDYHQGFLDSAFKATGFLILVLGWLLTSKEARAYLAGSARARRLGAIALGLGFAVYAVVTWRVFLLSRAVFHDLVGLDYLPQSAYAGYRIQDVTLLIFVVQNALLTFVACYFMLDMRPEPRSSTP